MAAEGVFIDTNVLVYAAIAMSPRHQQSFGLLSAANAAGDSLWISRQVLREYLVVMTRPQPAGPQLGPDAAATDVRRFASIFNVAEDGPDVTSQLLWLLQRHPTSGRQIHDANIVATMLVHGVGRLLTFNSADFRRFADLIEVEP